MEPTRLISPIINRAARTRPVGVSGVRSPYPTVVMVVVMELSTDTGLPSLPIAPNPPAYPRTAWLCWPAGPRPWIRATSTRRPTRQIDEISSGAEQTNRKAIHAQRRRWFLPSWLIAVSVKWPIGRTLAISIEIGPRCLRQTHHVAAHLCGRPIPGNAGVGDRRADHVRRGGYSSPGSGDRSRRWCSPAR